MSGLPKNRILAAYQICDDLFAFGGKSRWLGRSVPRIALLRDDEIKDALMILEELLQGDAHLRRDEPSPKVKGGNLPSTIIASALRNSREARIGRIQDIHRRLKARLLVLHVDERDSVERHLLLSFQKEDAQRVNSLLAEIRDLVRESTDLSPDHKRRLLRIASAFQAELEKPKSDFRVFLDGLIDASEALGQAGQKAKPAFDRIREIFGIAEKRFVKNPKIKGPRDLKRLPAPERQDSETPSED